ncbi:MAG: hypothetical protein HN802_07205 [Candidatus Jacksonbacteria bacterium]|nr:hypothetical protein [Candidatus Jacksonbacteria bacterium]
MTWDGGSSEDELDGQTIRFPEGETTLSLYSIYGVELSVGLRITLGATTYFVPPKAVSSNQLASYESITGDPGIINWGAFTQELVQPVQVVRVTIPGVFSFPPRIDINHLDRSILTRQDLNSQWFAVLPLAAQYSYGIRASVGEVIVNTGIQVEQLGMIFSSDGKYYPYAAPARSIVLENGNPASGYVRLAFDADANMLNPGDPLSEPPEEPGVGGNAGVDPGFTDELFGEQNLPSISIESPGDNDEFLAGTHSVQVAVVVQNHQGGVSWSLSPLAVGSDIVSVGDVGIHRGATANGLSDGVTYTVTARLDGLEISDTVQFTIGEPADQVGELPREVELHFSGGGIDRIGSTHDFRVQAGDYVVVTRNDEARESNSLLVVNDVVQPEVRLWDGSAIYGPFDDASKVLIYIWQWADAEFVVNDENTLQANWNVFVGPELELLLA